MSNSVTERIPYDWFEIDAIEGWLGEHHPLKARGI